MDKIRYSFIYKIVQGTKLILEEELKNSETSLLAETCFMVEQLQAEVQQELKCFFIQILEKYVQVIKNN